MTIDTSATKDDQATCGQISEMIEQFAKENPPTSETDPGILARDRLESRAQKFKRAMIRTYLLIATVIIAIVASLGGYLYYEYTKPIRYKIDYRECAYVDEKNKIDIRGRREYTYKERSLFGINYRLDRDIREKTEITIEGDAITVVGLNKDGWWYKIAEAGERGIMILNPADQYVFTLKRGAASVSYEQFCH